MRNSERDREKERRKYKKDLVTKRKSLHLTEVVTFVLQLLKFFCSLMFYTVIDESYFTYCLHMLCNKQNKA